ncbi:radical SAM/SPASM domain-containing protein [Hathewaya proteolytica]|nr:radical SAM protein [Hathewaya proteolytica]
MQAKEKVNYLVIWCTNMCNLRCTYCYAKDNLGNEDMDLDTAKKAIDILEDRGTLVLAGGEPLLNFQLVKDICSYIKSQSRDIKVSIQTNGTLIDENMAWEIKNLSIGVGVSLDGKIKVNNLCRSKGREAMEGILNLKNQGVQVNLNAVITKNNIEKLHELVDLAYYMENVNAIGLDLLRSNDLSLRVNETQVYQGIREMWNRVEKLSSLTGRKVLIREIEDAKRRIDTSYKACNYCYASKGQAAVITPKGDMYLCGSLVGKEEYYLGNINTSYALKALKDIEFDECKNCSYCEMCRKVCPSRAILNSRDGILSKEECALRKVCFSIAEENRD